MKVAIDEGKNKINSFGRKACMLLLYVCNKYSTSQMLDKTDGEITKANFY